MNMYGMISTPPPTSDAGIISRAKERIAKGFRGRRPWREMVNLNAVAILGSIDEAISRFRTNITYFRMNYAIMVVMLILFLSLLCHPASLLVFSNILIAWLFLYFLRDDQLVVLGLTIDDRVVLVVLSVETIAFLLLTQETLSTVGVLLGVAVVLIHAMLRKTDDLFVDEEAMRLGRLSPSENGQDAAATSS